MVPRAQPLSIRKKEPAEVVCTDNRDSFVTLSFFDPRVDPTELIGWLAEEGQTGELFFDLSQGAVNTIRMTQKKKLDDEQADTIRKLLDLDPD